LDHNWIKIADHIDQLRFQENGIAVAEVNGKQLCIGKFKTSCFAFSYKCPHASGILADGYIDALGNIVCPQHQYRYNIQNGRNVSGEGFYLKTWPVELRQDGVYIGMGNNDLFGDLNV
jgi:3-phenylpropionate/trans-cinnamate dioxygenase ferredoxin subunit